MSALAVLELQEAGFDQRQVKALAGFVTAQVDVSQLATKTDLNALAATTKADLSALAASTKSDLANVKADLDLKLASVELKVAEAKADTIKWVVGVGFAQVATILAVLKLFPGGQP